MQPSESAPSSPQGALVPLLPHPSIDADDNWQPILHASNQVVLYNPTSHALSIRHRSTHSPTASKCPYCHRPLPHEYPSQPPTSYDLVDAQESGDLRNRVANYFQLLAVANETSSRPITPVAIADEVDAINGASNMARSSPRALSADAMADGYFKAFFKEECKLGMGANGSVFLCQVRAPSPPYFRKMNSYEYLQHVLHGTSLGMPLALQV